MIERIYKITRISLLLAVRQLWKLLCNIYLLFYQPFLTIRTIKARKDKSQLILVSTMMVSPMVGYVVARLIWDEYKYGELLPSIGPVFYITGMLQTMILGYIGYWTYVVIKKNHISNFWERNGNSKILEKTKR